MAAEKRGWPRRQEAQEVIFQDKDGRFVSALVTFVLLNKMFLLMKVDGFLLVLKGLMFFFDLLALLKVFLGTFFCLFLVFCL